MRSPVAQTLSKVFCK